MSLKDKNDMKQFLGRIIANGYYDFQEIRISSMNQIRDLVRKKIEGINFNEVEKKKEKKDFTKKYTDDLLNSMMDALKKGGKITKGEYDFFHDCWETVKETSKIEDQYKRLMNKYIKTEPIYREFLSKIKGIGPILSTNLIKEFGNCERFDTVSRLWAYTGNHVIDGKVPKREKGKKLGFNLKLKTFTWKISDSLMKSNKGYYRRIYNETKEAQLKREYSIGELAEKFNGYKETDIHLSKGHAHNRALRKTRKLFLSHYWEASREIAGLSTDKTYVEGVLNHNHIISWRDAIKMEGCLEE